MNKNRDILKEKKELKEMPYGVPAGYFNELNEKLMEVTSTQATHLKSNQPTLNSRNIRKYLPYLAIAASLLILALATFGLVQKQKSQEDFYTEIVTEDDYNVLTEDLDDEEIIEYLIYTGVSMNTIAMIE